MTVYAFKLKRARANAGATIMNVLFALSVGVSVSGKKCKIIAILMFLFA